MIGQALGFLLDTAFSLFVFAALVRFIMQWSRTAYAHPFSRFVIAITDFAVRPLRRIVPGFRGYDLASLVAAWLSAVLLLGSLHLLGVRPMPGTGGPAAIVLAIAFLAALHVLRMALYLVMGLVFVQAIMSWVSPGSPAMFVFESLTRPFLRPVQRRLPPLGGVDLSPLVVFVAGPLLLMLPVAALERFAFGMLSA
ncbi:MAG: YggT family protein [Burkholderiales bacterium]